MVFVLLPDASAIDLLDPLATDMPPAPTDFHDSLLCPTTLSEPVQSSGFFSFVLFLCAQPINIWQMEQLTEMLFDLFMGEIYTPSSLPSLLCLSLSLPLSHLTLIVSFAQIKIMLIFFDKLFN